MGKVSWTVLEYGFSDSLMSANALQKRLAGTETAKRNNDCFQILFFHKACNNLKAAGPKLGSFLETT